MTDNELSRDIPVSTQQFEALQNVLDAIPSPIFLVDRQGEAKLLNKSACQQQNLLKAYRDDIKYRLYGLEPIHNEGWRVNVHEIREGLVYEDANVKVEAFSVKHGTWPNAYGFRFTTPDKVIVISPHPLNDRANYEYFPAARLYSRAAAIVSGEDAQTVPASMANSRRTSPDRSGPAR